MADTYDNPGDRFVAHSVMWGDAPCNNCTRHGMGTSCEAFPPPEGIPVEILTGEHQHRTLFPGDHGLLFKLKKRKG
jgi:hypothetical protein